MKHNRRTLTEALTDLSIVNEFMNALPSVGDSVPVDKFIEKSTPLLTAMQYLKSYKQLYSLYQTGVKTPQLQSLILSLFLIMQGISGSDELDNATIDKLISVLTDKVTAMIKTPTPTQTDVYPPRGDMEMDPANMAKPSKLAPTTSPRPVPRPAPLGK